MEYIYININIIINKRLKYIKSKLWNTQMKKELIKLKIGLLTIDYNI